MKALLKKIRRKIFGVDPRKPQIMDEFLVDRLSTIGDYTYIGRNCLVTKAKIGNYCSIANNCSIGPGEHDLNKISTNSIFYKDAFNELTKNHIVIGNDVWIAANVTVRRGVRIGNGAVIGANSFVNADVPDFAIVAGSPAKLIRYRFDEAKREAISKSEWWNHSLDEAKKIIEDLEKKFKEV